MQGTCNSCKKESDDLKKCAKCTTTLYCSRDCQKTDWKTHKKICGKQAHERSSPGSQSASQSTNASTALSPPKGLERPITKPFTRIDNNTYLHDRPEEDVYRFCSVLIDAYRMRVEDEYTFEGNIATDSLYGGQPSGILGFRKFLRKAASRDGLLPPWWNAEKKKACEALGMDQEQWQDLRCAVEKSDIIEHYGDPRFPMQLRMLAEIILGRGFAGNDGSSMRQMLMTMEDAGNDSPAVASIVDVAGRNISTFHRGT
ncbi:putative MYND domain protein [Nemania sp. NC0429]|nr:putative MYND domain protein [Nemania sp. NC0429]